MWSSTADVTDNSYYAYFNNKALYIQGSRNGHWYNALAKCETFQNLIKFKSVFVEQKANQSQLF